MKALVTGCAGFVGSNVVDRLLENGHQVFGVDNFSTGNIKFLASAIKNSDFTIFEGDLLDINGRTDIYQDVDIIFHFAANADVRDGLKHPSRDLQQNTIATFNILEGARLNGIKKFVFSSTGSVYGEAAVSPTPEECPFPIQTSLYGASKLACEGLISAYSEGYGMKAWIFRFVSILGPRYSHGHVFDFYKSLKEDSTKLKVLGDGNQTKSYLHIEDCISAIMLAVDNCSDTLNILNLGVSDACKVTDSIGWICSELGVNPSLEFSGGARGWVGDNPLILLDNKKITQLGWTPDFSIESAVKDTVSFLKKNEWIFDGRG